MKKHLRSLSIQHTFQYYDLMIAAFVLCLLISNIAATKLVSVGPLILDGGALLFPIVYIFGDVLTEVYGFRYARRAIWAGFFGMLLATACFAIVGSMPYPADYQNQAAYEAVLGFFPRIVLASLVAYLVGEFMNAFILARLKAKTQGRKLWLRLIGSTVVGGLFDTVIFCLIAFGGVLGASDMLNYIIVGWVFKTLVEIVVLPITYRVVGWLKKAEASDAYDTPGDFSPFRISLKD